MVKRTLKVALLYETQFTYFDVCLERNKIGRAV